MLGLAKNEHVLEAFTVKDKTYRVAWHVLEPTYEIITGINTKLASSSATLRLMNNCTILSSGGFYTPDGKPIGLLVNRGQVISAWQQNQLFNGVLGSVDGTFAIVTDNPQEQAYDWAVQAGPVLWKNGEAVNLALKNDQEARRILAGITVDGKLLLMSIVGEDSLFSGPTLAEMAELIPALEEQTGKMFEGVINLDGGTASALASDAISLRELKPIGSFVCVK
jgi:uncharacterized protein YigE (DUF2233 family)